MAQKDDGDGTNKGKPVETVKHESGRDPLFVEHDANSDPSLTQKIDSSARGLMADAFGVGSAGQTLSWATGGDVKGESSRVATGPDESSTWAQGFRNTSSNSSESTSSIQEGSFRTSNVETAALEEHAQRELDAFQGTGRELTYDSHHAPNPRKGKERDVSLQPMLQPFRVNKGNDMFEQAWVGNGPQEEAASQMNSWQQGDGADVVILLADSSFQPGLEIRDSPGISASDEIHEGKNPFELSKAELAFIEKLKAVLAQPAPSNALEPSNPLNLLPDFGSPKNAPFLTDGLELHSATSKEWLEAMSHYHEDVWGYLKPYVQAAEAEVDRAEENGPALRRLRMILEHFK